ncbi:MAG: hypothetical protein KJP02_05680 [Octadecabacter sp.]|nr:hypothetical protein [Octadecabacter sp.]
MTENEAVKKRTEELIGILNPFIKPLATKLTVDDLKRLFNSTVALAEYVEEQRAEAVAEAKYNQEG